jgi:hypothetical protein
MPAMRAPFYATTTRSEMMEIEAGKTRWTSVAVQLPDDDITVLLALTDGEVWPGYREGEIWRDTNGYPIETSRVAHWMHMPAPPAPSVAPMSRSTGMRCPICCAKAGEMHLPSCPERGDTGQTK